MNSQKIVTTSMENQYDQQIVIRQCNEPTEQIKAIYTALNYKQQAYSRKISVVPLPEIIKDQSPVKPIYSSV